MLHIGHLSILSADETTHELQAVVVTEANVDDAQAGKKLLTQTPGKIDQVSGDGGYDKRKFYEAAMQREVKRITVPPRRDAKIWQHGNSKKAPLPRDCPVPTQVPLQDGDINRIHQR